MGKRRYTPEEIIKHLRTFEIAQAKGETIEGFARSIGVHAVTLSKWKKEYGGLRVNQAKKMKDLEKENARLKCGTYVQSTFQLQGIKLDWLF